MAPEIVQSCDNTFWSPQKNLDYTTTPGKTNMSRKQGLFQQDFNIFQSLIRSFSGVARGGYPKMKNVSSLSLGVSNQKSGHLGAPPAILEKYTKW